MRAICLILSAAALLVLACAPTPYVSYAPPAQTQSAPAQTPTSPAGQAVPEGSQELVAEGVAAIFGGDKGIARDHAIEDAKRKAVEQGVGSVLQSESKVENFQLVYDKISSKATGYVSSYKIIDEQSDASLYRVTIRAVVRMADLQNDISGIINMVESQGRPRIMVLIRDARPGSEDLADPEMTSDLETMIIDSFVSKGFPVVDEEMVRQNLTNDQIKLIMSGDNKTAAELGRKIGAEIVVAGKATATEEQKSDPYTNQPRTVYSTRLNVRTINTRTSEILAATVVNQSAPFSRDAARGNAAEQASAKLIADILKKWQTQDMVTQIFCTNADNTRLQALKSGLNMRVRAVSSIILRDFTGNSGTIEVLAKSNSQDVFDVLNVPDWSVPFNVKGFSGNRIDLEFVPGGGK
jgi:curli biogenesis system outer membrane secretion channel CsgG